MTVRPIGKSLNVAQASRANASFGDNYPRDNYSKKEKAFLATSAACGVLTALAVLAKTTKCPNGQTYSLNPLKMFKNFKQSYFVKENFDNWKPIVAMGAGSVLGGLTGGFIIDKDKENRKMKGREALLQMGNISIPIIVVDKIAVNGLCKNSSSSIKAIAGIIGLFVGVGLANIIMNKINNLIFNNKNERGIKITDFSAHVDDLLAASECIFKNNNVVHNLGRIIPFALTIPGYEVGKKTIN